MRKRENDIIDNSLKYPQINLTRKQLANTMQMKAKDTITINLYDKTMADV